MFLSAALAAAIVATSLAAQSTPAADDRPALSNLPPMPVENYLPKPPGVKVESILDGLEVVWGLQFAPDGRLFLTEKPGRIRIVSSDGKLDPTPWATVANVNAETRERGLFGVALHPKFPSEPWVYVMYTAQKGETAVNRVSRFREVGRPGDRRGSAGRRFAVSGESQRRPDSLRARRHALHRRRRSGRPHARAEAGAFAGARCSESLLTARCRPTIPGRATPSGPTGCAIRRASRSGRATARCSPLTTVRPANGAIPELRRTTSSISSGRARTTDGLSSSAPPAGRGSSIRSSRGSRPCLRAISRSTTPA